MIHNPTIFGKILRGELPCEKVYEDAEILAFSDIHPAAPVHVLVVPKKYIPTMMDATEEDTELLGKLLLAARKIAKEKNLSGYKLHMNVGVGGGQVVPHMHLHLMGGWKEGDVVAHV